MKKFKIITGIFFVMIVILIAVLPVYFNNESETLNPETRAEAPGKFIELPQGITHYEEAGPDTAQTVLLVHGFTVPCYIWDPTFEALKEKGFHVIRFDLYGRGYSDRPDAEYNHKFFTKQITDLLMALNIHKPIYIVGLSMGGAVSTEFTVNHPEKVNKVVLIDPVHKPTDISILTLPIIGEYVMNVYVAPSVITGNPLKSFYNPEAYADWPSKFSVQTKYKGFKKAILSTFRNYMTEDKLSAYKKLGQLHKPVFLIWGEEDATIPYVENERIREVVECKFLKVENAGHLPHYEKPELVNARIIEFLNE
jgi:pimeloyl-ACP methyl ester carboxylesterase